MERLAWLLVAAGAAILIGYAAGDLVAAFAEFLGYGSVPLPVRIAVVAILAGLLLLMGVAVRDRLIERKRERSELEERNR